MNAKPSAPSLIVRCRTGFAAGLALGIFPVAFSGGAEPANDKPSPPAVRELPRLLVRPGAGGKEEPSIHWRNGEQLPGSLAGAGGDTLLWQSPLFAAPLPLRRDVIRRVDFSPLFTRPEGSFRLSLSDGSHLTGDIEKLDDQSLTFKAAGPGSVVIRRDAVVCLERLTGPGIIAAGPLALLPDKPATPAGSRTGSPLLFAAAGRTATPAFNLISQRDLDLPDKCLIDLVLRSDAAPDFKLTAARDRETVAVETWGDELVLLREKRFASAGAKIGDDVRTVQVRLGWDRAAGRCALYGPDGVLWAELLPEKPEANGVPEPDKKSAGGWLRRLFAKDDRVPARNVPRREVPAKGIQFVNKGSGVMVERFSITAWDGNPPPPVVSGAAYIETAAAAVPGEPVSIAEGRVTRRTAGGTEEVPLESIRAFRWPRPVRMDRNPEETTLWFQNGNMLRGRLAEIRDGRISLETAFAAAPVSTELAGVLTLLLPGETKPGGGAGLETLDTITLGKTSLHGSIHSGGGVLPHFQPVGAEAPVPPAPSPELVITRSLPKDAVFDRAPALLHVKSQETLPVTLTGISSGAVSFAWDAAGKTEISIGEVHAVQFAAPGTRPGGFEGDGWQMTGTQGASPARRGAAILLKPGTGIGHPYLLQGGDIHFVMSRDAGVSALRLRLFCQGTAADSTSVNFLIGDFGSDVYCGVEQRDGQMENQVEVPNDRAGNRVHLTFPGDEVQLFVNGVKAAAASLKGRAAKKTGSGMILETASLWGNQPGTVKLSGFSMQSSSTMAAPPPYTDEARREALLLPRIRRDDPPRHVLIGRNGDLLRGVIESMTDTHFAFRAGLETFNVPRDRVSAAVWVQKPDKEPAESPAGEKKPGKPEGPVVTAPAASAPGTRQWLDLTNGGRLALEVESWSDRTVTGNHSLLGKCVLPAALVNRLSLKAVPPSGALAALSGWKLEKTADPVVPGTEAAEASPETGKDAADFTLPVVEGEKFTLSRAKGKVVVLDFWATWCGPCVKSLPGLVQAMAGFPEDQVAFVAVNQGETKEQVETFLRTRKLRMGVALDADQAVARKYGVEGIPHTVVIDRGGRIALVKTGYEPEGEKRIAEAVAKALEPAPGTPEPEKPGAAKPEPAPENPPSKDLGDPKPGTGPAPQKDEAAPEPQAAPAR